MLITLDKITFAWEDLLANMKRNTDRKPAPEMLEAAESVYKEGIGLLDLKGIYEVFDVKGLVDDTLMLCLPRKDKSEKLFMGPRVSYLEPAKKAVIGLCTAGPAIVEAMERYSVEEEYLLIRNFSNNRY